MSRALPVLWLSVAACLTTASAAPREDAARQLEGWGEVIDPDGDCTFQLGGREDAVTISVPGTPHLLSAEERRLPMNAPRLIRGEERGDFIARVQVAGAIRPEGRATTNRYVPYHGAGLLLWQDPRNYVRLERAAEFRDGRLKPYVNFEIRKNGALSVSKGLSNADESTLLRLERLGGEIHASFRPEGGEWTSFAIVDTDLTGPLKVGVVAINAAEVPLETEIRRLRVSTLEEP